MIKIELSTEVRKEIEKIFLKDLFGTDPNEQGQGKFVKILNKNNSRQLLQRDYIDLYNYLYDEDKVLKTEAVKELLLADRTKMQALIDRFGSYNPKNSQEKSLADRLLKVIFQYENFSQRVVVHKILSKINITVCPYCNRSYIMTLKNRKVRPQLDHYYPKSKYPYLALSLYNLIPSCSICNLAKCDIDTRKDAILYPYEEEFGEKIVFATDIRDMPDDQFVKYMRGESNEWKVRINNPDEILEEQVSNQDDVLHLTDLYNEHKDYIRDIFKSFYINTDKRVEDLLIQFPNIFSTKEEVYSLMFMNDIRKENWGKRPLAKLSHDIYEEIRKLRQ